MTPSCLLGLAILHLPLEAWAEGRQIRFQEPDISPHHAEMGNPLSLHPKIYGLRADAKVYGSISNGHGEFNILLFGASRQHLNPSFFIAGVSHSYLPLQGAQNSCRSRCRIARMVNPG